MQAFALVLIHRVVQTVGTDDVDNMKATRHVNVLLILPLLIPMSAAILSLLARRSRGAQRVLGVAGNALLFVCGLMLLESVWQKGIQAAQMDAWPAPFGITIVADLFSAIMVAIAGFMGTGGGGLFSGNDGSAARGFRLLSPAPHPVDGSLRRLFDRRSFQFMSGSRSCSWLPLC